MPLARFLTRPRPPLSWTLCLLLPLALLAALAWQASAQPASGAAKAPAVAASAVRAALTVQATTPQRSDWPLTLPAAGSIAAWQEAVIGTESTGLRLVAVNAAVGDVVRRGQLLAQLSAEALTAERAQSAAAVAEAEALLAEAATHAERARQLGPAGAMSQAEVTRLVTAERSAKARVDSARARLKVDDVRLAQTRIVAPDDGVISARWATEGAMAAPGQELFRLIRRGRLEWRAEVPAADLARLKAGQPAEVTTAGGQRVKGTVRIVAPVVDAQTRNGLVYVDLQPGSDARAGMFVRGEFRFGAASALTLPQSAVLQRDGFSWVHRLGADGRVALTKVGTGRRLADRVEVTGLAADARVVASGGAFLADGDTVKVVP